MKAITGSGGRVTLAAVLLIGVCSITGGGGGWGQIAPAAPTAHADTLFPQTGMRLWGPFEQFWYEHGGLAQFGLPLTTVFPTGKGYDAQWFERAMFTYNPNKPDPYKVELQLLGAIATEGRRGEEAFRPASPLGEGLFFAPTGHNLTGRFLEKWRSGGGLPIYGYPLSEPFTERSKADGRAYVVQYFERARFELHPELAGTPFEVQLGLLGAELLSAAGGPQAFAGPGPASFYPAPASGGVGVPPGDVVTSPGAGTPTTGGTGREVPPAPALPPTTARVILQNDFSSGGLVAWQALALHPAPGTRPAGWRVENGVLAQVNDDAPISEIDDDAMLVTTSHEFGDFTLEAYFYATGGETVGAVLRYTDAGLYLVKFYGQSPNSLPKAELLRITGDGGTLLADSAAWVGYRRGNWHLMAVSAHGAAIEVRVDGQIVLAASDRSFTRGGLGFYAKADGTARFDNLRVSTP